MKKIVLLFMLAGFVSKVHAQPYPAQGISLVARWDDTTITPNSSWVHARYISCYGWADSASGHEYAIIGSQIGTHIIDLANPSVPVQADYVPGRSADCLWREYKTYGHYLYIVSDDGVPNSLQIADLSYLPDSVHVVYDSDALIWRAHTIFIDGDHLYAGSVSKLTGSYSMAVYSLANPALPQFLRSLDQDHPHISYVHDMFVKNDTVYASCGGQGLHMFNFTGGVFMAMDSFITSSTHYNHSSYLGDDGHTLFFTEEVPTGEPIIAMDVANPFNITMVSNFISAQGSTPHNPYVHNNLLYVAYYQEGLQVFDVSDPLNVTMVGFFDTFPFNTGGGYLSPDYQGAWGAYPFLPSGLVLVSDMQSGLFILNTDTITSVVTRPRNKPSLSLYPNPAAESVTVLLSNMGSKNLKLEILDMSGRLLISQSALPGVNKKVTLATGSLAGGIYLLRAVSDQGEVLGTVTFARQ